ncbi:MAG: hypothetical protein K940chlam3_01671 [Chlamydiae bacterium]|nr:hypothetical protein [Chlamydiota bacterium]
MSSINDPLLPYLILPFGQMGEVAHVVVETSKPQACCLGTSVIEKVTSYHGQTFYNRTLERVNYLHAKFLPSFVHETPKICDFGFGPKSVSDVFLKDWNRMSHTLQHTALPREKTTKVEGRNLVLHCMFRIAGYDDQMLFKITQIYNQRVGVDLYRLVCFSVNTETQNPILDSQHKNLNLFWINGDVCITGKIKGKIFDSEASDLIPIKFEARGYYNVTKDICKHKIEFKII